MREMIDWLAYVFYGILTSVLFVVGVGSYYVGRWYEKRIRRREDSRAYKSPED